MLERLKSWSYERNFYLVKSPFPNGVPAYYAEMSSSIYNAINSMASGNITPEEAVNQIDVKIKELLKN